MATIVSLDLPPAPELGETGRVVFDDDGNMIWREQRYENVDLDRLSPRARALAEAVAATEFRTCVDIWMESDRPIKETTPDWQVWYTPEQAERPERRPWRGWAKQRWPEVADPHDYLEYEARKIPAGWHVLGARPDQPVATRAYGMTTMQVLTWLNTQGRHIARRTWSGYVARGQAPQPITHVEDVPLWDPADIIAYANGSWKTGK